MFYGDGYFEELGYSLSTDSENSRFLYNLSTFVRYKIGVGYITINGYYMLFHHLVFLRLRPSLMLTGYLAVSILIAV